MSRKRRFLIVASVLLFSLIFGVFAASTVRAKDGNGPSDPTLEPTPPTPEPVEEPLPEQPTPVDQPSPTEPAEPTVEPSPTDAAEPTDGAPADEPEPLDGPPPVTPELTEEPPALGQPPVETNLVPMQVQSDIVLEVSSEVTWASYDEYHQWSIEKTVSEAYPIGMPGDELTWTWTITARDEPVRRLQVNGMFTVLNPSDQDVEVYIQDYLNGGTWTVISDCTLDAGNTWTWVGSEDVTTLIPAHSTLVCNFDTSAWISADDWGDTSSHTVSVYLLPDGPYFEATTPFSYSSATDVVNESAWVQDEQLEELSGGVLVLASEAPKTWEVQQSHTCLPSDAEEYAQGGDSYSATIENVASVQGYDDGEGQTAIASVEYVCHNNPIIQPVLALTAESYLGRQWYWDVSKYAQCDEEGMCLTWYWWFYLDMLAGESRPVGYKVVVETSGASEARGVRGVVTISNPDTNSEMNVDVVTIRARDNGTELGMDVVVDCGEGSPWGGIPPLGELVCSYDTKPTWWDPDSLLVSVEVGGVPWRLARPVVFSEGDPFVEYDATVTVVDTWLEEPLGIAEVTDDSGTSASWRYSHVFECSSDPESYGDEGMYSYQAQNWVSVYSEYKEPLWTQTPLAENWLGAEVTCYLPVTCTRGQGYWKTHSSFGPEPYDRAWRRVGEYAPFFFSGETYYEVVTAIPDGNAYYTLAVQYIAAQLNFLNGANRSVAQAAFDQSSALFNTYTPTDIATLKGNDPVRKQFLSLASTLEQYNSGRIGPGSCPG